MNTGLYSFGIILLYLSILLAIAVHGYRSAAVKTVEGFFLAGRGVSALLLPLTMIAALQSTFAFLGGPGMFYIHGIGFIVIVLSQVWVALMVMYFGHRIWLLGNKYGYLTIGDFFADRYESRFLKVVVSLVSILMTVVFLAMQYVGSAHAISGVAQGAVSYSVAPLMIAVFSLIYVAVGGAHSVVLTDAIQAVVLLITIVAAAAVALIPTGGLPGLFQKVADLNAKLLARPGAAGLYTDKVWLMQFIVLPFGIWLTPHVWVRSLMAKDEKAIARSALGIPVSQIVIFATSGLFLGLAGQVLLGKIPAPDKVVPLLLVKYTSWWLAAVILAGSIAAGVSTINSMILVIAQMFTQDLMIPMLRRKLTEAENLYLSRLVTVAVVIVSVVIALRPPQSLVQVVIDVAYTGLAQLAPGFLAGLYWRRANRAGTSAGLLAGLAILFYTRIVGVSPLGYPGFLWAFFTNLALTLVVPLFTAPPAKTAVERIHGYLAQIGE
ncbi:MAG: sodium/pantothenate symporter [Bacillota bacterium]|nr:sodium/pantothenate symporter [Bacillota bacterium]